MPTGFYPRKSAFDRILERVIFDPNDCWIWQGALSTKGYGRIGINNKVYTVHRVAYEIFKGKIPAGLEACHKCDVPRCCNPDHVFLGTHLDNMRDCKAKGRNKVPPNKKLTTEQVEEIRALAKSGMIQRKIAERFNITQSNVCKIMTGVSRRVS